MKIDGLLEDDRWYCQMWMEIVKFYGYPVYHEELVPFPEQEMAFHGMVNAIDALERHREIWLEWSLDDLPVTPELAEEFCREHYELTGDHVL